MTPTVERDAAAKRVLIIDDDDLVRATVAAVLETAGYAVLQAVDGADGLRVLNDCAVDLVITDIIMPEKEGIEVIRELRKDGPSATADRHGCPKIIAISGGGRIDAGWVLDIADGIGADAVLAKPFSRDALLETVRNCLGPGGDC